jgi:ribose 5-phosphate isomerase A
VTAAEQKRAAAGAAAARVRSGDRIGLGSGTTARLFVEAIAERVSTGDLVDVLGVPTSDETEELATRLGIPLTTLEADPELDVAVDGADEVDPNLDLIKGLGGALLREKIVAGASRLFVVVVDESKLVERLGTWTPVAVEVLPFGWRVVAERVEALGASVSLRERGGEVAVTDQGNYVLDCAVGEIADPARLGESLAAIPGVLGHGLFVSMADEVIVGRDEGIEVLSAPPRP